MPGRKGKPPPLPSATTASQAAAGTTGLAASATAANVPLVALVEDFFVARKPLKGSPHTEAAYRADLAGVSAHLAAELGATPAELRLCQVDAKALRRAFASFSGPHAASSIARAWAAWDQFFSFLVAEDVVVGNPMAAVAKPKVPRREPKALQGEGTPERLLGSLAAGGRRGRGSWPSATLRLSPRPCSPASGYRSCSASTSAPSTAARASGGCGWPAKAPRCASYRSRRRSSWSSRSTWRRARLASLPTSSARPLPCSSTAKGSACDATAGRNTSSRPAYRSAGIGTRVPKGALVHTLRHAVATRLAEDGASASEIQHLLGHESLSTSQLYIDSTATRTAYAPGQPDVQDLLGRITSKS